ncbi:MmcQ/YjbR family DNA-binding protein [Sediminicoccus sp. KRV36]|uniref:MmcQ/YjbR family DNA-binding protein n=1 Tax=Sediminicoccus sp. KRV36 TaxID=3133721 RepID=UPI00200F01D1|nr:MmcQ/YjbR family DNA-binding protein [Sediminicoccus rosea]UPY35142.1 MmcQ/YjbR family DNA-binding protein [Sediminicoccus rosea]
MSASLARLRRICLALPEAEERETWATPTFRVRDRIFCMALLEPSAIWVKAPRGSQEFLLEAAPERFFRPPYLGHKGWVGMHLTGKPDWAEVEALVRRSFSLVAPKSLLRKEFPNG